MFFYLLETTHSINFRDTLATFGSDLALILAFVLGKVFWDSQGWLEEWTAWVFYHGCSLCSGLGRMTCFPPAFSSLCITQCTFAILFLFTTGFWGFPGVSEGNESACSAGHLDLIPGLGKSPGGGQGNPLQYSCLENPMDRGAWRATVHGVAKSHDWAPKHSTAQVSVPEKYCYIIKNKDSNCTWREDRGEHEAELGPCRSLAQSG